MADLLVAAFVVLAGAIIAITGYYHGRAEGREAAARIAEKMEGNRAFVIAARIREGGP